MLFRTEHEQKERILKSFVALLLESDGRSYAYSGFIVEIRGRWFWVTASHCLKDISSALLNKADTTVKLVTHVGRAASVVLPKVPWNVIDGRALLRELDDVDDLADPARAIEAFDIAAIPLQEITKFYLAGVLPFTRSEWGLEELDLPEQTEIALLAVGIPDQLRLYANAEVTYKVVFLTMHLNPDHRVWRTEWALAWLPAWWAREDGITTIVGVSGGPNVSLVNGKLLLTGVISRQEVRQNVEFVGITNSLGFFQYIEHLLATDQPLPNHFGR